MKIFLNYLGFCLYYYFFIIEVNKQFKHNEIAFFDVHDLNMKNPKDKRNFNHLIKLLIDNQSHRDLKTINGRDYLVVNKTQFNAISLKTFIKNDEFITKPSRYDFVTQEPESNLVFVDFSQKRRIS